MMRGRLLGMSLQGQLACCVLVSGCHGRDPAAQDAPAFGEGEGERAAPQGCQVRIVRLGPHAAPKGHDVVVAPLDDVRLSVIGLPATARVHWRPRARPLWSTATLDAPDSPTTGFIFGDRRGVDVAGTYHVEAEVIDTVNGTDLVCTPLAFEVVPQDDLYIQLTWDGPDPDVDLHATRARHDGALCLAGVSESALNAAALAQACAGGDCSVLAPWGCPEWGFTSAPHTRPVLRTSDAAGFGPETIAVPRFPQGGDVLIAASMPSTTFYAVGAHLAVYIHGAPVLVVEHSLAPGELWEAALVRWPSAADAGEMPCVSAVEDGVVGECVPSAS